MRIATLLCVSALLAALVVGAGCSEATGTHGGSPPTGSSNPRPLSGAPPFRVTCTVGMLGDVVARLGGDRLEVETLMGPGTDPHLYTATPGDRKTLLDSHVILYCGHHLEGKMVDMLSSMVRRMPTLAVCEQVEAGRLRRAAEFVGAVDPHLWFDVALWARCAQIVCDFLVQVDPAGEAHYRERASAYLEELGELDAWAREQLASIPQERRIIVTAHDAFGYLGRAYNVEVVGIQGLSTESEAAVSRINKLVALIVARKVPAVFVESTISEKNVRSLIEGCAARGHTLRIGGSLYSDAMGPASSPAGTYTGMVRHNIETIVGALK